MELKLSVIIPTFNAENFLMDAVNSVINQTFGFENIELILVDDHSTDSTKNIILDLSSKYFNIVPVFLDENSGSPSKPRNVGINIATTEYVMFLDNDDTYSNEMCEVMYNSIVKENVDVVTCKINYLIDSKVTKVNSFLNKYSYNIKVNTIEDFPNLISFGLTVMIWNKIYKKDVILENKILFLEGMLYEDVYFASKFYLNANGIFILPDFVGYNYNFRTEGKNKSTSSTFNQKNLIKQFKGLMKIFDLLKGYDDKYQVLGCEMLLGWTKLFIKTNLEKNCERTLLNKVKPYYKSYKFTTHLLGRNLLFNIFSNIGVKILSVTTFPLVFVKKVLKLFN